MFTIPAPATPINPAERPIAAAVLKSALLPLHPIDNFNAVHRTLSAEYPALEEELHEALTLEQQARLDALQADTCRIVPLYPYTPAVC